MKRLLAGLAVAAGLAPVAPAGAGTPVGVGLDGAAGVQRTWSADQVRAPEARPGGRSGQGVTVAVLDTWVDGSHPDFAGRVLVGADCTGGTCRPGQERDRCDHGTHVAGTLASSSFGIAPRARVLPVRVLAHDPLSGECTGRPADVAAGISYAVSRGARVLNLSLGADVPGLASGPLPRAVQDAVSKGVVVVFSAGNGDVPVADVYKGRALVVAATGPDGRLASYSQRGRGVSLAAPGGDAVEPEGCTRADCITSLYPGGKYAVAAGTSMAAPAVSATAAMLLAQDPERSGAAVRTRLLRTARPLPGAGAGLLDAAAALGARATSRAQPSPTTRTRPQVQVRPALPDPSEVPLDLARSVRATGGFQVVDDDALPPAPVAVAGLLVALAAGGVLTSRARSQPVAAARPSGRSRR